MSSDQDELLRIMNKSFDDLKRRITSYVAKQEKKITRDVKLATKVSRKPKVTEKQHKKSSSSSSESK